MVAMTEIMDKPFFFVAYLYNSLKALYFCRKNYRIFFIMWFLKCEYLFAKNVYFIPW